MKVVCFVLFCNYEINPLKQDASNHVLGVSGKILMRRGAWLGSMMFGLAMQKFLNIG
jgi:hypothetical protein